MILLPLEPHAIKDAAEIGKRMLAGNPIPSYGSEKVYNKFFSTPEDAAAFDAGVMAYRWGQNPPADQFGRAGWEWEQITEEKSRERFVAYREGEE